MRSVGLILFLSLASIASAQQKVRPAPTAAEWAAMAKLPDFNGVWEAALGGGGARGAARPATPQLTPAYAAKSKAMAVSTAEDKETANCLPPGMPTIMGQPYPMEFLLTPGKLTIVI